MYNTWLSSLLAKGLSSLLAKGWRILELLSRTLLMLIRALSGRAKGRIHGSWEIWFPMGAIPSEGTEGWRKGRRVTPCCCTRCVLALRSMTTKPSETLACPADNGN